MSKRTKGIAFIVLAATLFSGAVFVAFGKMGFAILLGLCIGVPVGTLISKLAIRGYELLTSGGES